MAAAAARAADMARREEEFLLAVLDKAAREAAPDAQAVSVAAAAAVAVRRLCALLLLVESAALAALAVWAAVPSLVQRGLLLASAALAGASAAVHATGWLAARARSLPGVRTFLLLSVAVAAACALARRELELVRGSQQELLSVLDGHGPRYNLTEDERVRVLDGGAGPALTQRFVFDGPAWFLSRLEQRCSNSSNSSASEPESSVGMDTYALRWDFQDATCVDGVIGANLDAETAAQIALALLLMALTAQVALASVLLLVADPETFKRRSARQSTRSERRARRLKRAASRADSSWALQPLHRVWSASIQLLALAVAAMAIAKVGVSWQLLDSCAFDAAVVDPWVLASALGSGLLTLVGLLLIQFTSKARWSCLALCCGVAFNIYALIELASLSGAELSRSGAKRLILSQADLTFLPQLETWYNEASRQRCSIVVHWLSHVCQPEATRGAAGSQAAGGHSVAWDSTCQHEFAALLADTVTVLTQFLAVLLALELAVLALIALPLVHHVLSGLWGGCRSQWRRCWSRCSRPPASSPRSTEADQPLAVGKLMQQPSLEYSEALELYLSSVRSTSEAVREAERAAFEDEWARKTRRPVSTPPASTAGTAPSSWLPSYRTMALSSSAVDGVVIAQRDFEAIVRTLLIRRLVTRCKMDVSVSLSSDGRLLFLQLSASDNVLMGRLCDLDEYELEFSDAIDPGWAFWRQHGEMERDRKVLEPHEVKQQFKLLLREASAEPGGSARPGGLPAVLGVRSHDLEWFRGESLAQVSARIHALRRVSRLARGELPPPSAADWLHAAARVRYSPRPQLQFLYKKHPNRLDAATGVPRRASVLRTVDCLRLTRLILDEEFDVDAMLESGLIASFQYLHSASRMDFVSRAALASSWVAFWRRSLLDAASTRPTQQEKAGQSSHQQRRAWWRYWCCCRWVSDLAEEVSATLARWSPHRQPVESVRDYFGERIAFFVAWSGLFTQLLTLPALAVAAAAAYATFADASLVSDGALAALWGFYLPPSGGLERGRDASDLPGDRIGALDVSVGVAMVVWGLVFAKAWERQSAWYQLKWGSVGSSSVPRPVGGTGDDEYGLLALPSSRLGRQAVSWTCIALLASCHAVVVLVLVLAQGYAVAAGWVGDVRVAVVVSCACQAALAQWVGGSDRGNGSIVSRLASRLSRWEGHEDDDAFQRAVVLKLFALQLAANLTGLLLLLALGVRVDGASPPSPPSLLLRLLLRLPSVGLLGGSGGLSWLHSLAADFEREIAPTADALVQLQTLLSLLLLTRIGARFLALGVHAPAIAAVVDQHSQSQGGDTDARQLKARAAVLAASASVEAEYELRGFAGVEEAFADVVVDLALVSMFSSALPVAPLLVFVDVALALRVNAAELSCLTRRPSPESSAGVGLWSACVRLVVKLAAGTTVALVGLRASWSSPPSEGELVERAGTFLASVACCWLAIELLWVAVPGESGRLAELRRRHAFLVQRYVFRDGGDNGDDRQGSERGVKGSGAGGDDEDVGALLADPGAGQGQADVEMMLESVHERAELLQRLNVAMRRPGEPMHSSLSAVAAAKEQPPTPPESAAVSWPEQAAESATPEPPEEQDAAATSVGADDPLLDPDAALIGEEDRGDPRTSLPSAASEPRRSASSSASSSEHMVVGYYRPVVRPQGTAAAPPVAPPSTAALLMGRPHAAAPAERQPSLSSSSPASPPPMKRLSKLFARATPAQLRAAPTTASSPLLARDESEAPSAAGSSEADARERADGHHPLLVAPEALDQARDRRAVQLGGMEAIAEAARRQQLAFDGDSGALSSGGEARWTDSHRGAVPVRADWQRPASEAERPWGLPRRARGSVGTAGGPPAAARHSATQLAGLEAVREAASRRQFDFSSGDEAGWT